MEIVQRYTLNGLGELRIKALEDKVICEYKSLVRENSQEFSYEEIDPKFVRGKSSDGGWPNVGWFLIAVFICLSLFDHGCLVLKYFELTAFVLAVLSFGMLLVKQEYVSFYLRNSERFAFAVKRPDKNKQFVDFVVEKIEKANQTK